MGNIGERPFKKSTALYYYQEFWKVIDAEFGNPGQYGPFIESTMDGACADMASIMATEAEAAFLRSTPEIAP